MITIKGTHNRAICYTDALEQTAQEQIKAVCDQEIFSNCKIRIMPDVHAGMGCTIGTTMSVKDKVVPSMVGVDIGCGMETIRIAQRQLDLQGLDALIRQKIPSGRNVRTLEHPLVRKLELSSLRCASHVNLARASRSIGTLGGGNHFIEVDKDEDGALYVVVHSGSRHLGNEVAKYYQEEGLRTLCGNARFQINKRIEELKAEGRNSEIQEAIVQMKQKNCKSIPHEFTCIEGEIFEDYIHDMKLIQQFAVLNRQAMMETIVTGMQLSVTEHFTTIHNYIDMENMILRKGAVSAKLGEKLLIPINMRDGSLICVGKGNDDWNCSAPHGAGRLMSRKEAFARLSMEEYKEQMADIYSTCVVSNTLDESPMAYKPMEDLLVQITPTVDIVKNIKPIYNFKATE